VSRVGASGGGKAYRQSRPLNYYGALSIIVILGLITVLYSRYEYQNPSTGASTTTTLAGPTLGHTFYVGLAADVCGTVAGSFTPNSSTTTGYSILADNVARIAPKTAAEAGGNGTIAKLISEIPGFTFTSSTMQLPPASEAVSTSHTFTTGSACPAGTKYANQKGRVVMAVWTAGSSTPVLTTNPASVTLATNQLVTFGFEPNGVTPARPSTATLQALVKAEAASVTTTTSTTTTTSKG